MTGQGKNLKILVFAPHPDDDIIGCGGSIVNHLEKNREVFVIYVTNGDAECQEFRADTFTALRKMETRSAANRLGIKDQNLFFLDEKPWRLDEERVLFGLIDLVRRIQPDVCYIPHILEAHLDHQIVSKVAFNAINMAPSKWFRQFGSIEQPFFSTSIILAYEVWTPLTAPNFFEDITRSVEKKMAALSEHKTQAVDRYEYACLGINAFRGAMHEGKNIGYSEAFQVLKIKGVFPS